MLQGWLVQAARLVALVANLIHQGCKTRPDPESGPGVNLSAVATGQRPIKVVTW